MAEQKNAPTVDEKAKANLAIWSQVETTDKDFTRPMFAGDGVTNLTSINHNYQIKRATALFGPIGKGWGYTVKSSQFVDGGLLDAEKPALGNAKIHTIHLEFWYEEPGATNMVHKFEHFGQTTFVGLKAVEGTIFTDEDAPKKSLTDAIGKALSMLGFSADIYGDNGNTNGKVETDPTATGEPDANDDETTKKLKACKTGQELSEVWSKLSREDKIKYNPVKDGVKTKLGLV